MTHPFDITGLVSNLKASADMLRLVESGFRSMDVTEARLKLATASKALLEAVDQLTVAQHELHLRDERIAALEAAFESRGDVKRLNDAYYLIDGSGQPAGQAFCVRCWEDDHRLRGLVRGRDNGALVNRCPACRAVYDEAYSGTFEG